MVKEFLLGDNPFIGISHLAQVKARAEKKEATLQNKVNVIKAAIEGGATGFTFSTHPANLELFECISNNYSKILNKLNYYILVPYVASYVRRSNILGTPSLAKWFIRNALTTQSLSIDTLLAVITINPNKLFKAFIMNELMSYFKILPIERVKSILLHEILTDLIIAYNIINPIKYLAKLLKKEFDIELGLESRNIERLNDFLTQNRLDIVYVMTPLNPLNYQVATINKSIDELVDLLSEKSEIIAINIMASGAVSLDEAIKYLKKFRDKIYAVTSATTRPERAYKNFQQFKRQLIE